MRTRTIDTALTPPLAGLVDALAGAALRLPPAALLELHRLICREAARIRLADPVWQQRRRAGLAAAGLLERLDPGPDRL